MPELPEVETVRRGLQPAMEGKRILGVQTRRKDLRFPFPANFNHRLIDAKVKRLGRRAKYLVADLSTGEALIMHLGMTGRFTVSMSKGAKKPGQKPGKFHHEGGEDEKHDHVVFEMQGGAKIVFNDARRFGFMDLWSIDDLDHYPAFEGMGLEPISNEFSGAYLEEAFEGKKTPVKAALLDQRVVAGLGNIYVCEALFRAQVNPRKLAGAIKRDKLERLAVEIRKVIEEAIAAGGSTISDFATTTGELGYFQHRFQVYDREGDPCIVCDKPIKRMVQSGRSTFYCAHCQK
ncbi:MAG TPA: bifunctional DNA-formamidopyrimidine glycosylase/DNA-(apurinic or apyrimidinic site) lyase [Hyphomonadaceae bacterium]|jgi:formamidopyrimidine-DNA glycosylase|nr:bifunctional DNA-formamidopyrimidine glycosylase/DNA-(apurinic or apyrimidinic site) lyase [Hyphomonadaceae bacterium]